MIIIGITGTNGAGKGTVVDYLVKHKGFHHFSVRGFLIDELKKRQININRDSMFALANELRKQNGASYIIEQLCQQAKKLNKNSIIESVRTTGEVEALKKFGNFILLAVDAQIEIRYKRSVIRNSETDNVTFEEFVSKEQREMVADDPGIPNISKCIHMADYIIMNDGNVEELGEKISSFLTFANKLR